MRISKETTYRPENPFGRLGSSLSDSETKPIVEPLILFEGLKSFDDLIREKVNSSGMVAILLAGVRGSGKTETAPELVNYTESLFGRKPARNTVFALDAALHERSSPLRTLDHPLEEYYRWDTLQIMLRQAVTSMKNGEPEVRVTGRYLRSLGTTESKTHPGKPWSLRLFFRQPNPVVVVEGTFALDPRVTEMFHGITDPITILLNTDQREQLKRVLNRKPETRTVDEETKLNEHDVRAWENHKIQHKLGQNADILAWSYHGRVIFYRNPHLVVSDSVGFLF